MTDTTSDGETRPETGPEAQPADADAPGNAEVQEAADTATEQGYLGTKVDQADDEEYTVKGVTKDA